MAQKVKVKKRIQVTAPSRSRVKIEPSFDGWSTWSGEEYHTNTSRARDFYYTSFSAGDLEDQILVWMKQNGYSKEQVQKIKHTGVNITTLINCKLLNTGMPDYVQAHDEYWQSLPGTMGPMKPVSDYIRASIETALNKPDVISSAENVTESPKASVYERVVESSKQIVVPVDEWLDQSIQNRVNFDPTAFDVRAHFLKEGVTQAHARRILEFYQFSSNEFKELQALPSLSKLKQDETENDLALQLKEAYSDWSKTDINKLVKAYENIQTVCDQIINIGKATRKLRTPKARSADQQVEKLVYLKHSDKYSLVSINPATVIGADELWVFNVKYRKLGRYVAQKIDPSGQKRTGSGLGVKGTTLIGFDPDSSMQKTLRNPEEQLKEFKSSSKSALRAFFEQITTTETVLSGRIGEDTVLLKAR